MKISLTGTLIAVLVAGGLPVSIMAQTPPASPPTAKPPVASPAPPAAPAAKPPATPAPPAATPPAGQATAPAKLPQELLEMDTDKDGSISEDEFVKYRTRFFDALDADKDGTLTREEFIKLAEPPYVEANDANLPPLDQRRRFLNDEFTNLDANQDGKITREEVTNAFKANFQQLDRDRDGKITVADLQEPPKQITRQQFLESDTKTFDRLDANKDGKLNLDEFYALAAGAPADAVNQLKEQLAGEFKTIDANKDGFITKQEFTDFSVKTFDRADTNKDGIMTEEEDAAARRAQQIARQSITRQDFVNNQTNRYMTELDENKDGKISRAEFIALAGPADQKPAQGQPAYQEKLAFFNKQFDDIDANKDKFIDRNELAASWTKVFNNLDLNKDGKLTPQEIAAANRPQQPQQPKPPAAGNPPPKPAPAPAPAAAPKPTPKPQPAPQPAPMAPQSGGSSTPQAPIVVPPPQQMR